MQGFAPHTPHPTPFNFRPYVRLGCAVFVALIGFLNGALAKEVPFEVSVDRNKISLGEQIELNLTFNGTQNVPSWELPVIDGIQSRYLGPSTRMSIVNGRVTSSITHVYTLAPLKAGSYKIGPLKFDYNADTYTSNVITLEVVAGQVPVAASFPAQDVTVAQDINDRIFLVLKAAKDKAYINELVPLTIKLYVNQLGIRDIQYPEFTHEGFSKTEFEQSRPYQEMKDSVPYAVIEFSASVFGMRPGDFNVGPATLKCNLIVKKQTRKQSSAGFDSFFDSDFFDNFFDRYQMYPLSLKSAEAPMTVLPLPEENKPENFTGAIGDFTLEVAAGPTEVNVGDPITLKMTVQGEGNFNTVDIPKFPAGSDFKIYEPQIKQEKDKKSFEQIIMPLNDLVREIPQVSLSFFNPKSGQYQVITKGPFPVVVAKPKGQEEAKIIEPKGQATLRTQEEVLGRDIIYIKEDAGDVRPKGSALYRNKLFLWFQFIPFLALLAFSLMHKRSKKLKSDLRYARQLLAPRKAKEGIRSAKACLARKNVREFYDCVFGAIQDYLGDKFHLPSQGITGSIIDEFFAGKSIPEYVLQKLRDIFEECDMARYAVSGLSPEDMQETLKKLQEVIDYFQRNNI